jgi:Fe-S-cluster containining protein
MSDDAGRSDPRGEFFALNGLSIDALTINQDGELRVAFDLPVEQTTVQYEKQLQGVRVFDLYQDPELSRLCRDLFRAVRRRVEVPDAKRLRTACDRCRSSDCCRKYNVLVTEGDIDRLCAAVGLSREEFGRRYLRPAVDWCEDYPFQLTCDEDAEGDRCIFLREDSLGRLRCGVYEHRPRICRDFDEKSCDDFGEGKEAGRS